MGNQQRSKEEIAESRKEWEQIKLGTHPKYTLVSKYENLRKPVEIRCSGGLCDGTRNWFPRPSDFIYKINRCKWCAIISRTRTHSEFINEFKKRNDHNEFEFTSKYTTIKENITYKHIPCGKENSTAAENLIWKMVGCPNCIDRVNTKGSKIINDFLIENNIEFEQEKRFAECRNKIPLPFDFYLNLNGNEVCIEYDGEHHFKPVAIFGGEDKYLQTITNDKIKNDFCIDNGIILIRIKYDDNIIEKLKQNLL